MQFASSIAISALVAAAQGATAGVSTLRERSLSGEATYYGGNTVGGTCSFSTYTIPTGLYGTALSSDNWDNSANCGRCITVTGPSGNSIQAMITDQCPNCGTNHLDLYPDAFAALAEPSKGVIDVTWDYIDCPITTPLYVHLKEGVSAYWFSIDVVNANKEVTNVQVSADSGSTWLSTTRLDYNYFQISSGTGTTTVDVKVTSGDGDIITINSVSVVAGDMFTASANFPLSSTVANNVATSAIAATTTAKAAVATTSSAVIIATTSSAAQVATTQVQSSIVNSGTSIFSSSVSIATTFPAVTSLPSSSVSIPPVASDVSSSVGASIVSSTNVPVTSSAIQASTSKASSAIVVPTHTNTVVVVTTVHASPSMHTKTVHASVPIVTETATQIVKVTVVDTIQAQASETQSASTHTHRHRKSRRALACSASATGSQESSSTAAASSSDLEISSAVLSSTSGAGSIETGADSTTEAGSLETSAIETESAAASSSVVPIESESATHLGGIAASSTTTSGEIEYESATHLGGAVATSTMVSSTSSAGGLETALPASSTPEVATHLGGVQATTSQKALAAEASASPSVSISVITITTCVPSVIYSTIPLVVKSSTSLTSIVAQNTTTPTSATPAQYTGAASSVGVNSSLIFGAFAGLAALIMA